MLPFLAFLDAIQPVSPALRSALEAATSSEALPARHLLLRPGQVARRVYFIESGLVRGYTLLHADRDFDAFETSRGLRAWRH